MTRSSPFKPEASMTRTTLLPPRLSVLLAFLAACKFPALPDIPLDAADDAAAADGLSNDDAGTDGAEATDAPVDAFIGATFARGFGSTSGGEFATRVAVGSDAVVFAGVASGSIDLGGGSRAGTSFLAQMNTLGQHVWSKGMNATIRDVAIDSFGNVYMVGSFGSVLNLGGATLTPNGMDLLVAKFDNVGSHVWSRGYGGAGNQEGRRVAVLPNDDVIICGEYTQAANFGGATLSYSGADDVFVAKVARSDGAHAWSTGFGGVNNDTCAGLVATSTGEAVATGSFYTTTTIDGNTHQAPSSAFDMYAVGINATGAISWSQRYGGTGADFIDNAFMSPQGDVLVVGNFGEDFMMGTTLLNNNAGPDGLVARMSPTNGNIVWAKALSGGASEYATSVSMLGTEAVVSGWFTGTAAFGTFSLSSTSTSDADIFVARLRYADGDVTAARRYGGAGADGVTADSAVTQSTVVLAGGFQSSSIDFGVGIVTNTSTAGGQDAYLAKVIP